MGPFPTLAPLFAIPPNLRRAHIHKTFSGRFSRLLLGAGVSMGLAEALSDDGQVTGRGSPILRGLITGSATALGGMLRTHRSFLLATIHTALLFAYGVVVFELIA